MFMRNTHACTNIFCLYTVSSQPVLKQCTRFTNAFHLSVLWLLNLRRVRGNVGDHHQRLFMGGREMSQLERSTNSNCVWKQYLSRDESYRNIIYRKRKQRSGKNNPQFLSPTTQNDETSITSQQKSILVQKYRITNRLKRGWLIRECYL